MDTSSRPPFDPSLASGFTLTQTPNPDWKAGQGANRRGKAGKDAEKPDSDSSLEEEAEKHHYKVIVPGQTKIAAMDLYKIMLGGMAPRPIALVSTMNKAGHPNLTVISWYQMVSHDPPLVMLSFGGDHQGRRKDSEVNIDETGEFTISSCSEPYVEALNYTGIDAPHGISEYALSGLTPVASRMVRPPRVKEAPFSLECVLDMRKEYSNDEGKRTTVLVIGRVKALHIRSDCLLEDGSVDVAKTLPVARISGKLYTRTTHGYELPRLRWEEEKDRPEVQAALAKGTQIVPPDFDDPILSSFP